MGGGAVVEQDRGVVFESLIVFCYHYFFFYNSLSKLELTSSETTIYCIKLNKLVHVNTQSRFGWLRKHGINHFNPPVIFFVAHLITTINIFYSIRTR
jgi:hypothetical protein